STSRLSTEILSLTYPLLYLERSSDLSKDASRGSPRANDKRCDRLFPSGQFNHAIAGSLAVNSIMRSLSYSQQAPILLPPLQGEG
ncbi:MAG: hypothetical protein RIM23_02975, partial [Coleofasciculus sp. G3-WIS-01]|uniref:hypothetical protein n=1 Tax=Coleofasciculus sp. G3-WIS-01 TaxID=3069528 RepID=UPI0033012FD3